MQNNTMDNPQVTKISSTDLAWLAGIWDGEGYISIRRSVLKGNKPQYSPRVGVTNTNPSILYKVRNILDAYNIKYHIAEYENGKGGLGTRQTWDFTIDTLENSSKLLSLLLPYLVGKKFQAELLIDFVQGRLWAKKNKVGNSLKRYTPNEFQLIEQIYQANGDIRGTSETIREDAQRAMI